MHQIKLQLTEGHASDYVLMAMTFDKFAQVMSIQTVCSEVPYSV